MVPGGRTAERSRLTARRYRTVEIQAGDHVITAADPMPDDLRQAVDALNSRRGAY